MVSFKKLKKILIFSSIFFIFIISISSLSACDNNTDIILTDDSSSDDEIDTGLLKNDYSFLNCDDNTELNSSENSNYNESQDDLSYFVDLKYDSITNEYTLKNIIYKVKVLNLNNGNDIELLNNHTIKLIVKDNGKIFSGKISNGMANIKVAGLSVGTHSIDLYFDDEKQASSTIKITKSSTKVLAPSLIVKYKKNTYFKMKVLDSYNNPVKKITLNVQVFTGKKYKTYNVKTNAKGFAYLKTNKLSLGFHKVIIKTKDKNYKISKNSNIAVKKKVGKQLIVLYASAPSKTVLYKNDSSFTIKVLDKYNDVVKNFPLKVQIFTGKNSKNYAIKTDSKGIVKMNTKKLSLGSHKIIIKTGNKNYKLNKNSKIIVQKIKEDNKTEAPKLKSLQYYQKNNGNFCVKLIWNSKKSAEYQVLRKSNDDYNVVSTVKSNGKTTTFYDKVDYFNSYTYSVREVKTKNNVIYLGLYDEDGLKLIDRPNVSVDFQNLKATITWEKIEIASKYLIFRKMGRDGTYKCIAKVDSNYSNYTDSYYESNDELGSILNAGIFVDPSFNNLFYTVRACIIDNSSNSSKISYGLYYNDGDFNLEAPSIVSLENNIIKWGKVPNADGYLILKKSGSVWKIIAKVNAKKSTTQSFNIGKVNKNDYYSIKAFAYKNGIVVYSDFDNGFSLMNYSEDNSNQRILFIGDSITYGSPYKSDSSRHIFSIPNRVAQLLGCIFYNPSIPGSTYHDLGQIDGKNIEKTSFYRYRITREVVDSIFEGKLPGNWESLDTSKNSEGEYHTKIEDYNIVVLAAGTNDYMDETELGSTDDTNTTTFNGALNHIMNTLEFASMARIDKGLSPIKVIFVDLYYSDRTYDIKVRNNRDVTPNNIGLTLRDYQNALNEQFNKWESQSEYLSCYKFKTRDYDIVNEENCPYKSSDNLHYTKFTYGQYGNAFAKFLVEEVF